MKEKYYDLTTSLIMGITFIILAIFLIIGKVNAYQELISIIIFILMSNSLIKLIRLILRKQDNKNNTFLLCIFNLLVSLIFLILPEFIYGLAPFIFSIYLIMIALTQYIMCYLEIKNKENLGIKQFLLGSIYLSVSIPIIIYPIGNIKNFLTCLSIYILFLGISFIWDAIIQVIPHRTKDNLKRKIRITLPKIVEAIIPYSVMIEINRNLEVEGKNTYTYYNKSNKDVNLNVLIHTSNRGFNRMGHIDIYFNNKVISYGCYDEGSRLIKELFGDGVLFTLNSKEKYINFCIDNSKKTIFDFGIHLNKKEYNEVEKRIEELLKNTVIWNHTKDKKYKNGTSYAGRLYKKTKATFYKFKSGKYKTYFVLGTNCCFLADDILGKSGMDILSINGIITPGTYYDYLNRALKKKTSNVIYKEIYNKDRRPNKY